MKILTCDLETHFSDDYTLKKMTTEAYIRDPRFEALGLGVRHEDGVLEWIEGLDVARWLEKQNWSETAVLAHHAHFDGLILSHHYGVKPAFWYDTLSMAHLALGNHVPAGLGMLAKHYRLPEKNVPYDLFKGRRRAELDAEVRAQLAAGCLHDCELTYEIFTRLRVGFPEESLRLIDATARMFTEPTLIGDGPLLATARDEEISRKAQLLATLGVTKKDLGSNAKFEALLANEGVEMEFKEGKNGPIPATAKTDEFMRDLLDDSNPRVSDLAYGRLACKSSIEETRAGRISEMAGRGPLPLYLTFAGAHTTRWSGGDKVNFQNLPKTGSIRRALMAPPGYVIAKLDAAQQEYRLVMTLSGQEDALRRLRNGVDAYLALVPAIYGVEAVQAPPEARQVAKITTLACQYGVSAKTILAQLKAKKVPDVDMGLAEKAVTAYRLAHPTVVKFWRNADHMLQWLAEGAGISAPFGLPFDINHHKIILPNGAPMHYNLEWDVDLTGDDLQHRRRPGWKRKTRNGYRRIYGAALVENICQALGAVAIGQSVLRVKDRLGLLPVLLEHDAGAWVIPEAMIKQVMPILIEEVGRSPAWLPSAPMSAEGSFNERYGK